MNKKERKAFIAASLATSTDISSRLRNSSRTDRSRPVSMKFHPTWRHPDCPVNRWYTEQTSSSTEFTTIRHCRNTEGPFFHEFLLIALLDGAICRLERMGEGSHANAIRRIGCISHDIIQWFSTSGYESDPISKEPFDLIAEITFPQTFDLLDILAICHTVHHSPRCSAYSLQRYNCYFLCLTVMNVLARRVTNWENVIDSQATWSNIVESAIDQLRRSTCEEPHETIGLGICELLDPSHPNPRSFILDSLCTEISKEGVQGWRSAVSATLWIRSWEQASKRGLKPVVDRAVDEALSNEDTCAAKMRDIINFDGRKCSEEALIARDIAPGFAKSVFAHYGHGYMQELVAIAESVEGWYQTRSRDKIASAILRRPSWFASLAFRIILAPMRSKLIKLINEEDDSFSRIMVSRGRSIFRAMHFTRPAHLMLDHDASLDAMLNETKHEFRILSAYQALQRQQSSELSVKLAILDLLLNRDTWKRSLLNCVSAQINQVQGMRDSQVRLGLYKVRMTKPDSQGLDISVEQFQEQIHERIRAHSNRVDSVGLASADLVGAEMEIAMEEVWERLPSGHGGLFR